MIITKNKYILGILFLSLFSFFTACDEAEDADVGGVSIQEVTGEWVVDMTQDGVPQGTNYIATYNTSTNSTTEMWIDDQQHGWGLKAKVNLNLGSKTFTATDVDELYYDVTVTITDGTIIENGATAPSGTVTDAISFNAVFSDIPDRVWTYSGYRRTGFAEDDVN